MSKMGISDDSRRLLKDGKDFFWLADTIWSAFTNINLDDWRYYLKKRRQQGFSVLQINALAQWDRGESLYPFLPFQLTENGQPDYSKPNESYFSHAKEMCQMAKKEKFELALVVLWSNQVPGTWANAFMQEHTIPKECLISVIKKIYDTFDEFEPIYIIGGDTDFPQEETCEYYETALQLLEQRRYGGLKTIHLKGRYTEIPDCIADKIDFYMYQSGHNVKAQQMAYTSALELYTRDRKKPVINSEPCYEQMGYSHNLYGRFGQREIRKAAWQGLLSGACAGVTYGAHGVWNWVTSGYKSSLALGEGFDAPFAHQIALEFPGAWDYGEIREFYERNELKTLEPYNQILLNKTEEIRVAKSIKNQLVIYLPTTTRLKLKGDYSQKQIYAYDLSARRRAKLEAQKDDDVTYIEMHPFAQDAVLLIE